MSESSRGPVLRHLGSTKLEFGPGGAGHGPWRRGEAHGIVWLVLDRAQASANTVSHNVIEALAAELDPLEREPPRAVVIRSGKPVGFAAGADITEFEEMGNDGSAELLRQGPAVLDRLAALDCPTICVAHGAALGAGFEIALACDWRIAVDGASFGFPEVQLGLHPGLGGTFRLPALIDPTEAMTLLLTGKSVYANKAKTLGIADVVTDERHVRAAVDAIVAGDVDRGELGLKARLFGLIPTRSLAARQMRSETEKKAPKQHCPAPRALIDLWRTHGDDPEAMQPAEIESFAALLKTDTSKDLRRVFFPRQTLKENGRGDDGITHFHVIGAGAMGAEIAAWATLKGKTVTLGDVELEPLGQAVKQARAICKGQHLSGIATRDALDHLMPCPKGYGVARVDLVIEAAPERPDLKKKIYAGLAGRMKGGAILVSNTSSLRLVDLCDAAPDTTHFAGMHFFNPVSKMQLVEVVRHEGTDDEVVRRLAAFCGAIDRLPVRVTDSPGFLVNRALTPYLMEAMVLMDEVIDAAAMKFGMPIGPVALSNQVGLDICLHVAESLKSTLEKPMSEISEHLRKKIEAGDTGKRSGQGLYDWSYGKPRPAHEIDGAMIFATGFAPFRGGPIHYARARGVDAIRGRLEELAERYGPRFAPDLGWKDL